MPARPQVHASDANSSAAVDVLLAGTQHPHLDAIAALRRAILDADPAIAEGVKWASPSFRTHEYFATLQLRIRPGLALILHRGAKARATPVGAATFDDPDGQLRWLGPDRARLDFADAADLAQRTPALQALLRRWITLL